MESVNSENLRIVYSELCSSYRAIDDFRTKLLGFLPVATGAGIFFLVTDKEKIDFVQPYLQSVGIFGFVITIGLFFYEFYGIKKCSHIIWAGMNLEREMNIGDGQFTSRPGGVARLINEPFAAGVIYPAVLAAWTFIALAFSTSPTVAQWSAVGVFLTGFAVCFVYKRQLELQGNNKQQKTEQ